MQLQPFFIELTLSFTQCQWPPALFYSSFQLLLSFLCCSFCPYFCTFAVFSFVLHWPCSSGSSFFSNFFFFLHSFYCSLSLSPVRSYKWWEVSLHSLSYIFSSNCTKPVAHSLQEAFYLLNPHLCSIFLHKCACSILEALVPIPMTH